MPGGTLASASIAAKEFLPILLAGLVWGQAWHGCTIRCNCDNEAVVQVINSRYARDPLLAHMLRCLFFICARYRFTLVAMHIPGKKNVAADAISPNNLPLFYSQVPEAAGSPTPIPSLAVLVLACSQVDWLSKDWTSLFSSILHSLPFVPSFRCTRSGINNWWSMKLCLLKVYIMLQKRDSTKKCKNKSCRNALPPTNTSPKTNETSNNAHHNACTDYPQTTHRRFI